MSLWKGVWPLGCMSRAQIHTSGSDLPFSPLKQCRCTSASPSSTGSSIISLKFNPIIVLLVCYKHMDFILRAHRWGWGIAVDSSRPGQRQTKVLSATTEEITKLSLQNRVLGTPIRLLDWRFWCTLSLLLHFWLPAVALNYFCCVRMTWKVHLSPEQGSPWHCLFKLY